MGGIRIGKPVWLLCSLLLTQLPVQAAEFPFKQFVVFGDSLSDTGNDYLATAGQVPVSPPYDQGRFTSGPGSVPASAIAGVWHEQLAAGINVAPALPALAGGTNFAFGGAESGGVSSLPPTMQVQVASYLANNSASAGALYLFWGGANDLFNAATPSEITAAATSAAENIATQIATLAADGAQNFLWVNLPPLDATPRGQASADAAALSSGAVTFNQAWSASIAALTAQFPDVHITGVDAYSLFGNIVANPAGYGITNISGQALVDQPPNPDAYLFWDEQHPTSAGHRLVADLALLDLDAAYNVAQTPEPATANLVAFCGFAVLLGAITHRRLNRL